MGASRNSTLIPPNLVHPDTLPTVTKHSERPHPPKKTRVSTSQRAGSVRRKRDAPSARVRRRIGLRGFCGANGLRFVCGRRGNLGGTIGRRRTGALNFYAGDALAVHLDDAKAKVAILKTFASARNEAELIEDEAAHRCVGGILGKRDVVLGIEIADIQSSVENDSAIRKREWALDYIELVVNFSDYLFENIFQGDQAKDAAEFVYYNGQAHMVCAQLHEQFARR